MTNLERRQVLDRTKALQSVGVNISVMDTLRNPGMLTELERQASTGQTQEIATTEEQQMQGLQNRPPSQIPDQYVMKNVAPNSTIHTKNVKAPLDIDYKDPATGHLVESYKSVQPGTVLPGTPHNQSVDVVESPAKSMMKLGGVRRKFQNAGREEFKTGVNSFVSGTPIQDAEIMPYTGPGEGYVSPKSLPPLKVENDRTLRSPEKVGAFERVTDILASPTTAFRYSAKNQPIPGNIPIDNPDRTVIDMVLDSINPFAMAKYGRQIGRDVEQGNKLDATFNAISAIPGIPSWTKKIKKIKPFENLKKIGKGLTTEAAVLAAEKTLKN